MVPQLHSILTWKSWFSWSPIYGNLLASYLAPSHNHGVGSSTTLPWVVPHFQGSSQKRYCSYSQTQPPMNINTLLSPQDITPSLHVLHGSQVTKQNVSNHCHISSARTKVVAVADSLEISDVYLQNRDKTPGREMHLYFHPFLDNWPPIASSNKYIFSQSPTESAVFISQAGNVLFFQLSRFFREQIGHVSLRVMLAVMEWWLTFLPCHFSFDKTSGLPPCFLGASLF